ncbi:hypothetical protein C8R44DRAFT_885253 [Mycena epipterygia]|nr:hypothetical protein C8R44DRAFT_885253 [Mycena epipterygia]
MPSSCAAVRGWIFVYSFSSSPRSSSLLNAGGGLTQPAYSSFSQSFSNRPAASTSTSVFPFAAGPGLVVSPPTAPVRAPVHVVFCPTKIRKMQEHHDTDEERRKKHTKKSLLTRPTLAPNPLSDGSPSSSRPSRETPGGTSSESESSDRVRGHDRSATPEDEDVDDDDAVLAPFLIYPIQPQLEIPFTRNSRISPSLARMEVPTTNEHASSK